MVQVLKPIIQLIERYGFHVIIILGVVITILLIWNGAKLSGKKDRLEEALLEKEKKYFKDALKNELISEENSDSKATPDKIRAIETDFYNTCSLHDTLVQIIPIFPLLGILGTVAGLMIQSGDISHMTQGLNTALDTTFGGLIFAIILKAIEALFPSRIINSVEIMLDDFYKKMSIAEAFRNEKEVQK